MCIQGPGRLGWPRFRKEQPPIGTHPHPANTAILPSFFFFFFSSTLSSLFLAFYHLIKTSYDLFPPFIPARPYIPGYIIISLHPILSPASYTPSLSLYCLYNLYHDPVQRFHCVAKAQKHHLRFHSGPNGRRGTAWKNTTASNAQAHNVCVCRVCVCVMSMYLASVWPVWISAS